MNNYHLLTKHETDMLDQYFDKNLSDINKMLNIDMYALNEHHFYTAIESMFPTNRSEQLYNNGNNIAYISYIESLKNTK